MVSLEQPLASKKPNSTIIPSFDFMASHPFAADNHLTHTGFRNERQNLVCCSGAMENTVSHLVKWKAAISKCTIKLSKRARDKYIWVSRPIYPETARLTMFCWLDWYGWERWVFSKSSWHTVVTSTWSNPILVMCTDGATLSLWIVGCRYKKWVAWINGRTMWWIQL